MWFACYCEPRKTLALASALEARGLSVECPSFRYRRREPRRNRIHEIERPLIGGMFFCAADCWPLGKGILAGVELELVRRVMWMGKPAVISSEGLASLRSASSRRTASRTRLLPGTAVVVDVGAFAGARALVLEERPDALLVQIQGMNLPVVMAPFLLRPG